MLSWVRRSKCDDAASALPRSIPVFISTLKKDVNLEELRHLYSRCDHSCNRFSKTGGSTVDMKKLRTAISRSDVVVSVFCKSHHAVLVQENTSDKDDDDVPGFYSEEESLFPLDLGRQNKGEGSLGDMFQDVLPLTPSNGQLVGFGRAYSDYGLTASIHDLMVLPSLQRMGIGKLIVNRITRLLTSRDIYDIAALCLEHERPFFKACGFADDRMGSTTMMFTKSLEA
ncbi:Glucosamine 6-phosphate N-acetyltransferase [Hirschfeldia incana]|nr:Glucosamine 6-phosphate N-acetyltransferase [Hirschfeldia incana]